MSPTVPRQSRRHPQPQPGLPRRHRASLTHSGRCGRGRGCRAHDDSFSGGVGRCGRAGELFPVLLGRARPGSARALASVSEFLKPLVDSDWRLE
jgi:hypothetical protein